MRTQSVVSSGGVSSAHETKKTALPAVEPIGHSRDASFVGNLLYGLLTLAVTCGPLLIPGVGLKALMLWMVGGSTIVFVGILVWGVVQGFRDVSAAKVHRRKGR